MKRFRAFWTPLRVLDAVLVFVVIYVTIWALHPQLLFSSSLITGGDTDHTWRCRRTCARPVISLTSRRVSRLARRPTRLHLLLRFARCARDLRKLTSWALPSR